MPYDTSNEDVLKLLPSLLKAYEEGELQALLGTEEVKNTIVNAMHQTSLAQFLYKADSQDIPDNGAKYTAVDTQHGKSDGKILPSVLVLLSKKGFLDTKDMVNCISVSVRHAYVAPPILLIVAKEYDTSDENLSPY